MAIYSFSNVSAMVKSALLSSGDVAITLGYYTVNDGGEGEYAIVSSTKPADGGSVIQLTSGLKAELMIQNSQVNVKQFGAKGDGVTDDREAINNSITYVNANSKIYTLSFPKATYRHGSGTNNKVLQYTITRNNLCIEGNGSEIKCANNNGEGVPKGGGIFKIMNSSSVIFRNFTLDGNIANRTFTSGGSGDTSNLYITNSSNVIVENVISNNSQMDGICLLSSYRGADATNNLMTDISIRNCITNGGRRMGISVIGVNNVTISQCKLINTGIQKKISPASGIDIEAQGASYQANRNVLIDDCYFDNNVGANDTGGSDLIVSRYSYGVIISRCSIHSLRFAYICSDILVRDCLISNGQIRAIMEANQKGTTEVVKNINIQNCSILNSDVFVHPAFSDLTTADVLFYNYLVAGCMIEGGTIRAVCSNFFRNTVKNVVIDAPNSSVSGSAIDCYLGVIKDNIFFNDTKTMQYIRTYKASFEGNTLTGYTTW